MSDRLGFRFADRQHELVQLRELLDRGGPGPLQVVLDGDALCGERILAADRQRVGYADAMMPHEDRRAVRPAARPECAPGEAGAVLVFL